MIMNKYRVDVYKDFWNCDLLRRMYIEAENEKEARSKGYDLYCKSLIFRPLAQPCLEVMICK